MQFLTTEIIFLAAVVLKIVQSELHLTGKVCFVAKRYTEEIQVKKKVPKTIVKNVRCSNPFKLFSCKSLQTIWVEETEPQTVWRSETVPECCRGYKQNDMMECVPDCQEPYGGPWGCKFGECVAPGVCECFDGYISPMCELSCPEGFWGKNCNNECNCFNDGKCDNINGCVCHPGWKGIRCESSCEEGYYGYKCKNKCTCNGNPCNHITGECISTTTEAPTSTTLSVFPITTNESPPTSTTTDSITSITSTSKKNSAEITVMSTTENEIVGTKISETSNTQSYGTRTTGIETTEETTTDAFAFEVVSGKGSSQEETIYKWLHFLPSLSVLTVASFLIIGIAAKWVFSKHRRKTKFVLSRKDTTCQSDEQIKFQDENFLVNNFTVNPAYLTDVDLNGRTTTLETFKPVTAIKKCTS